MNRPRAMPSVLGCRYSLGFGHRECVAAGHIPRFAHCFAGKNLAAQVGVSVCETQKKMRFPQLVRLATEVVRLRTAAARLMTDRTFVPTPAHPHDADRAP